MDGFRQIGSAPTALLRALHDGPLSRADAMVRLGLNWRQMTNAARKLVALNYMLVRENAVYQLTEAGDRAAATGEVITGGPKGQVKLVRDTFRERAWRAMRIRRNFTIGDIVADAAADCEGQPRDNAARYIARLKKAGYVRELPVRQAGTAASSNGFKRFALVKNTGPRAPVYREGAAVIHDPNMGRDIPCDRN